jgi:hypothetical protein
LDIINNSIWNNSVYDRTKKKTMKKSKLRQLVKEIMAKGFVPNPETGKFEPHYDDLTSTKLSDLLTQVAKRRPKEEEEYQGDPNMPLDEENGLRKYTVFFYTNDRDHDWDVMATSEEDAIEKVKSGEATGPYGQTLPRLARKFSAKEAK